MADESDFPQIASQTDPLDELIQLVASKKNEQPRLEVAPKSPMDKLNELGRASPSFPTPMRNPPSVPTPGWAYDKDTKQWGLSKDEAAIRGRDSQGIVDRLMNERKAKAQEAVQKALAPKPEPLIGVDKLIQDTLKGVGDVRPTSKSMEEEIKDVIYKRAHAANAMRDMRERRLLENPNYTKERNQQYLEGVSPEKRQGQIERQNAWVKNWYDNMSPEEKATYLAKKREYVSTPEYKERRSVLAKARYDAMDEQEKAAFRQAGNARKKAFDERLTPQQREELAGKKREYMRNYMQSYRAKPSIPDEE